MTTTDDLLTCHSGRHPWTADNIQERPDGRLNCRPCQSERRSEQRGGRHFFTWDEVEQPDMPDAACQAHPQLPWVPDRPRGADQGRALGEAMAQMRSICAGCPELSVCREFAMDNYPRVIGVWGGLATGERREIRRAGR